MPDLITVLSHPTNFLTKTWQADGTIKPYDDAKFFKHNAVKVDNVAALSVLLTKLEAQPKACVIRGVYVGDALAKERDDEFKAGRVRRVLSLYDDPAKHTLLVEVDNFEPLACDPVRDPVNAILEYVATALPKCFFDASFHWQLSNSAGHAKNAGKLKAHVWFWLRRPYTSEQLKQWATVKGIDLDKSVLNPVQVHYTAAPCFAEGVADPVPVRSGFYEGLIGDDVDLVIDAETLNSVVSGASIPKPLRLKQLALKDPRAVMLYDRGMVKSVGKMGELRIVCPRSDVHSGESGESSTVYYLPNTGGYAHGHFVCKHEHCQDVAQSVFDEALGYDDFKVLTEADAVEVSKISKKQKSKEYLRDVPEALHLTTDLANANRIVKHFKNSIMFSNGIWFAWVGTHWSALAAESYTKGLRLSSIIHKEAEQWIAKSKTAVGSMRKSQEEVAESLRKWAARSEMKGTVDAAMVMASKLLEVPADQLNRLHNELNCLNGTLDLKTLTLRPHDPQDFLTLVVDEEFDPNASYEFFWSVLLKVTREDVIWREEGRAPVAQFLKRWFGYCATGSVREHKFVVHFGSGRNGKSTIIDMITGGLGGYSGVAAPGLMMSSGKERHPTEIADLFGKRLVTAHESGDGGILREDFIKQATGGDKVKARFMRGDFFEFAPTNKLQLLTNHKPTIKGQDVGIWDRTLLVNYAARFGTQEELDAGIATHLRDTSILEKLSTEKAGILRFIAEGGQEWFRDGLNPPDSVLAASKSYKEEQDRVKMFIEERCELGADYRVALTSEFGGLYNEYQNWCKESGFLPLAKNRFAAELERLVPHFNKNQGKQNAGDGSRKKATWIFGLKLVDQT